MHSYCSNGAFMHIFTPTNVGVFLVKMCKMKDFFFFYCILQEFASIDVDALTTREGECYKNLT